MENYEVILGCKVYTYEIRNNDIYGSDINEEMLRRNHVAKQLNKKCERFSPMYSHGANRITRSA